MSEQFVEQTDVTSCNVTNRRFLEMTKMGGPQVLVPLTFSMNDINGLDIKVYMPGNTPMP